MGRIEELYEGNDGQERSVRVRTQGREITRALYQLYPLELTLLEKSISDETAEDLRENNTSVVEMLEDKTDPNLSSDCRPRRESCTKASIASRILWTMMSTKKTWGVCRELQTKLTHIYE